MSLFWGFIVKETLISLIYVGELLLYAFIFKN